MTELQVRDALEKAPSQFVMNGLDAKKSINLGGGDYGVPGPIGPVNITDLDKGIRRGTLQDVINLIKIYQGSKVMTMNSNNGVEANDVDPVNRHLEIMRALLNHTDKPFYTKLFSYEEMHQAIDMVEIAAGEKLRPGGKVYLAPGSAPSMSPCRTAVRWLTILSHWPNGSGCYYGNCHKYRGDRSYSSSLGTITMQMQRFWQELFLRSL